MKQKISFSFLVIFSACTLLTAGVVWACAGGDEEEYSVFSPEYFVDKQYTPFFYDGVNDYYGTNGYGDTTGMYDNNIRYNHQVMQDWDDYLQHRVATHELQQLLFTLSRTGLDSVCARYTGKLNALPAGYPDLSSTRASKKKMLAFLNYLVIARDCEAFAVRDVWYGWGEDKPVIRVNTALEAVLKNAFQQSEDAFIRQRLLFQMIRYYYFRDRAGVTTVDGNMVKTPVVPDSKILTTFQQYDNTFPHNLVYYRTLGYVAGYYYLHGAYAMSNYLYSLGYNYSLEMKVPSKWSFHPQEEKDWQETLRMAKSKEEQITLWHMLGMEYDPARAIQEIAAIDPKSEKMELLLSRLVNSREATRDSAVPDLHIIDGIAQRNNNAKPYFWNLGAGYLHYMQKDYAAAAAFYAAAQKQIPATDRMLLAQYKLLTILLQVDRAGKIDGSTEAALAEPLAWLADLNDGKDTIRYLRFYNARAHVMEAIAAAYKKQGNLLKAICFSYSGYTGDAGFYTDNKRIEALKQLLTKPDKTAFEKAMVRYYPLKIEDLYYHQGTMSVYQEKLDTAIELLKQAGDRSSFQLAGNPFNGRLNDCHDCDHEAPQKQKYTPLSFVQTLKKIKTELNAGTNVYANALLLGNAYYNITHYGNARLFYESSIIEGSYQAGGLNEAFREILTSQATAEKYYLLALQNAANNEQKAKCTFLAAKCERNEMYNQADNISKSSSQDEYADKRPPAGKYFELLKNNYSQTNYYKEALKECGYLDSYSNK